MAPNRSRDVQLNRIRTIAAVAALLFVIVTCSRGEVGEPVTTTTTTTLAATTTTTTQPIEPTPGLVVIPTGGADAFSSPDGSLSYRVHESLMFPILAEQGEWLQVLTTCSTEEWVRRSEVDTIPTADQPARPTWSQVIAVLDPGHGGRDWGAVGATRTREANVNLEIATLVRERLESSNSIDWDSGEVTSGTEFPAIRSVLMTRAPEGPDDGEVELGLAYRAETANKAGADVLVAIHNNSSPSQTLDHPGSDVFYSVSSPGSDRLASLIHEELIRGFSPLANTWRGGSENGVVTRVDVVTGEDFYGLLRRTEPTSVIVEGLYISEKDEEAILNSATGQQAYADAVYRGLVRYFTTDEWGSEVHDPKPFDGSVGTPSTTSCVVPTQP